MISYNTEGVSMPSLPRRPLMHWIRRVAAHYSRKVGNVNYLFCNDEHILKMNRTYLQHDYYTDVITFDYSERMTVNGDIAISLDTVKSNAQQFGKPYEEELLRVIIHGILHLCGLNDKAPGEREIMEAAEDKALQMWEDMKPREEPLIAR
ncbi:MAG: rRNA maturation RNase YbeY [Bacteroidaceae bacterium]|nr:rRNA maturation RNase YbeY [Bacteroidaceae bacterium]